ncbi:MAG: hypothetical protein ABFD18_13450 [Syntrophomonas sp.]
MKIAEVNKKDFMLDLTKTTYPAKEIRVKRKSIAAELCRRSENINGGNIKLISTADLELLFGLYDRIFFEDWFENNFKGRFKFSLSRRMTRSAGKTISPKNIAKVKAEDLVLEIRISVELLFKYDMLGGHKSVAGISTKNNLEALQVVFEHELCHIIELLCFKESNCSKDRFKSIATNLFGHSESHHKLPTTKLVAQQKYGFRIGDAVSFICDGKKFKGVISNINKRATIMVVDLNGTYADQQGKRYSKYYVPLGLLK